MDSRELLKLSDRDLDLGRDPNLETQTHSPVEQVELGPDVQPVRRKEILEHVEAEVM